MTNIEERGIIYMADNRIAYGMLKKAGIDTEGMSPKEAWEKLKNSGYLTIKRMLFREKKRKQEKFNLVIESIALITGTNTKKSI